MTSLLPLDDFRRIIGLHPFYFWNLTTGGLEPIYPNNKPASVCLSYIRKYAWQGADYLGREDIEQAIETAEKKLREYLGYSIAPEYKTDTVLWPRYFDNTLSRSANWDTSGRFISVALPFGSGHVQAIGIESRVSIGTVTTAGASLVFSDADGDGLNDTFTATIATTQTDPDKVALYLAAGDRLDSEALSEKWRIRPVKVTISAGTATIKGRYWLLAKPIKYEGILSQPLDPTDTANFVNSLLVYTRTTDPTGTAVATAQANVIWETEPCHGWWCCCSSCSGSGPSYIDASSDPGAYGVAVARAGLRDPKMGRVTVGEALYDSSTGFWSEKGWGACREPDRVIVRHYSGYPLESGQVAQKYQTIVARLAAAEMTKPVCACEPANKNVHQWSFDLARTGGANDERFAIAEQDLNNPFGTRRGQVAAWREVRNLRLTPGLIGH
jgi:hypothetical protein